MTKSMLHILPESLRNQVKELQKQLRAYDLDLCPRIYSLMLSNKKIWADKNKDKVALHQKRFLDKMTDEERKAYYKKCRDSKAK